MDLTVMDGGVNRAYFEREAPWNGIEAAVAEGIAAQQAPSRKKCPAASPKAPDRLCCVRRAGGLIATATGKGR